MAAGLLWGVGDAERLHMSPALSEEAQCCSDKPSWMCQLSVLIRGGVNGLRGVGEACVLWVSIILDLPGDLVNHRCSN